MRNKIIGVTVGTPISPARIDRVIKPVKTVNGVAPDENGNVEVKASGGNALKGSASGEAVALKDVSRIGHNLGVRVESKNIIPFPYSEQLSSSGGVNFVYNADGTITITGTPTEYVMIHLIGKAWPETPDAVGAYLEDGETYTLSMTGVNGEELLPVCMIIGKNKSDGTDMYIDANKPFTVDKSVYRYDVIRVYINAPLFGQEFNCTIAIQLEKGKATPYTPYIADTSGVRVLVQGANLLSLDKIYRFDNCSFESGVIKQTEADTNPLVYFKVAVTLDNGEQVLIGQSDTVTVHGKVTFQFTCNEEINTFRFGLNGRVKDTTVMFEGLGLPAGTYIASCNVINATQGSISWKDMQIALVDTEYEPYKEPIEYAQGEDIKSIYPTTTIMTDTAGAVVEVEYNKDANKVVKSLEDRISALEAMIVSQ